MCSGSSDRPFTGFPTALNINKINSVIIEEGLFVKQIMCGGGAKLIQPGHRRDFLPGHSFRASVKRISRDDGQALQIILDLHAHFP